MRLLTARKTAKYWQERGYETRIFIDEQGEYRVAVYAKEGIHLSIHNNNDVKYDKRVDN